MPRWRTAATATWTATAPGGRGRARCVRIIPVEPSPHPPRSWRGLDEATVPADPLDLFAGWMSAVFDAGLPEPTAMVLATVSAAGQPRARTVLLKEHGPAGFVFYTNRTSTKGRQLAQQPRACLLFPWYPMQRQVIIEGTATAMSISESEPYFHSRAARLAARRLGQQAVVGAGLPGRAGRALPGAGAALAGGDRGADAGFLGRLPGAART